MKEDDFSSKIDQTDDDDDVVVGIEMESQSHHGNSNSKKNKNATTTKKNRMTSSRSGSIRSVSYATSATIKSCHEMMGMSPLPAKKVIVAVMKPISRTGSSGNISSISTSMLGSSSSTTNNMRRDTNVIIDDDINND